MSRRLNRHKQPPYDFRDVPDCDRNLEGSCVVRVQSRPHWFSCIGELVHICNEAVRRQGERKGYQGRSTKDTGKPLSLFYIADRLDTDDPIRGYMVRSRKTGWLQGFIITTTFTTWQRWFRWNSVDTHAGILDKNGFVRASNSGRKVDASGELAMELNKQSHHGDPKKEGIIWPKVAEISLLGALGCGGWLVQLILQEMEASAEYEWVVLQALENSIGFYERMGFTRVGAIAKNFEEDQAQNGNNCKRGVTIAYRHWTWDNENVKTLPKPSYMMAKKIKHKTKCSNAPTADRTQELKRKANRGKRRQGLPMKVKSKTPSRLEQLENLLVKRAPAVKVTKKKITSTPDSALKERSRIKTSRRDESTEDDDELKTEYLWAWECAVPKETLEKHLNGEDIEASDEDDKDENNDDDNGDRAGNDSKNPNQGRRTCTESNGSDIQGVSHPPFAKRYGAKRSRKRRRDSESLVARRPRKRRTQTESLIGDHDGGRANGSTRGKSSTSPRKINAKWHLDFNLVWKSNPDFKPRSLRATSSNQIFRKQLHRRQKAKHKREGMLTRSLRKRGAEGTRSWNLRSRNSGFPD